MIIKKKTTLGGGIAAIVILLLISACGSSTPAEIQQDTPTPTPTVAAVQLPTATPQPSPCEGLSGELEIQVLVGPAEAVGLTPHSVGSIPFAVTTDQEPFQIEGSGGFTYQDILSAEWGTYEVTMEMAGNISGTCQANETTGELAMTLEMVGSQLVVVTVEGSSQEYPWEGTLPFYLAFPLEDGASVEGEGYVIVLHLQ